MIEPIFSGHETFSLRITWLPKAVAALICKENPFSDPRKGMETLGIGKNMVQSLAFWIQATGIAQKSETDGYAITDFGKLVFDADSGKDPYLENTQTLWLLHWNLCQGWMEGERHRRPYAWHHFVNKLRDDEITATETVDHFQGAETSSGRELSGVTLRQHFDIFLRTYVDGESSGPRALPEDTLDSPLTPLRLIRSHGEKKLASGRRETVYRIQTGPKPSISLLTFRHCLHQWWNEAYPNEQALTVRQISLGDDSPGRVFRLPEASIHDMLVNLSKQFPKELSIIDTRSQRSVQRLKKPRSTLSDIYKA
jgi:Protein of unknown function (DUF4007)